MLPSQLLSYYNDEINTNLDKIFTLEELIGLLHNIQTNYIYRNNNQHEVYTPVEPHARRLFVS